MQYDLPGIATIPEGLRRPHPEAPKRGKLFHCPRCERQRAHYARNLCRGCYMREFREQNPEAYQRMVDASAERQREQRRAVKRGWRRGSWNDPAVQAHHRTMIITYYGVDALADWGLLP